ncbi:MAG TPA: RNA-directed DNA polymerase [Actinomycetota bacterium]
MGGASVRSGAWAEVVAHDARFEFPDPIGFADGGADGERWRGGPWAAGGRVHREAFLSKPDGSRRVLAVLDPAVHARYRAVVADAAGAVERSLGPEVTGGRCQSVAGDLEVEAWGRAWRRHVRRVRSWRCEAVVRLDVRDCFGSIPPDAALDALARSGADRAATSAIERLLRTFEADGIRGLPVGPEPSAVLANAVLSSADLAMRSLGLPFVRWTDDVTVAVGTSDPGAVAEAWAAALVPLGLRPAHEKTRIEAAGPLGRPSWFAGARPSGPLGCGTTVVALAHAVHGHDRDLCERAVVDVGGPDPHRARAAVARLALLGGRRARTVLRDVRRSSPHLRATADWGLRR